MDKGKCSSCKVRAQQHGFSLLELSIALAIIGLLAGGIVAARSMIRSAEISSIGTDFQRYTTAMTNFNEKYDALPGDMSTATNYWGTAASCPGTDLTPSTTAATCNGNGDTQIQYVAGVSHEGFRAWQHLSNAGFVQGAYTSVTGPASTSHAYSGVNVPKSRYGYDVGFSILWMGPLTSNATYFDGPYRNPITAQRGDSTGNNAATIRPEDMQVLDKKFDDGAPAFGVVRTQRNSTNCTISSLATTDYAVSVDALGCTAIFMTGL